MDCTRDQAEFLAEGLSGAGGELAPLGLVLRRLDRDLEVVVVGLVWEFGEHRLQF